MDGCVGRSEELKYLEGIYDKAPAACAICGHRHLGKTALIKGFCADKPFIYITGISGLKKDNLREISRSMSRFAGKGVEVDDILDLFPKLREVCGRRKVVVILDRFSDLVENFPEVNSYLRSFMNREINTTKIMLIVSDNDSSIFGRFFYTLDLKPMSYLECKGFHPDYTPREHLTAYSIVGGTPAYQELFQGRPEEVIRTQFFDHMSVFSLEAEGLVSSEALANKACVKILSAMARGAESVKDIAARADLGTSMCTKMVEDMEHRGLLQKEVSSGISRRAVYTINNNLLRFFYEVVNNYTQQVEFESPSEAYAMARADISAYVEKGFKAVCMDYVTHNYTYDFVGKLRRKDDSKDSIIDFVASVNVNDVKRVMVARCRLDGDPFCVQDLDDLKERAKKVEGSNKIYAMFSGCGFNPELRAAAKGNTSIILRTLEEVYSG